MRDPFVYVAPSTLALSLKGRNGNGASLTLLFAHYLLWGETMGKVYDEMKSMNWSTILSRVRSLR